MEFEDLREALDVFSLTGKASLQEIKARHRALVKRHHPDAGGSENDRIREINAAYQILLAYCRDYRFSFSREEFLEQRPEERLRQQFAQDPIWGG
ncbi:DnaJ domain-containing protein [Desulfuromonas soudanensis]|uniref:DnaJ domain-containing protein n=1 Tax=Desulfuromonas soudanensis TaxID=1603606 RepID=A0A0M4D6L0_9BACT|nr:J domain-containing protein [Desulfuromonas soudanensis]ALC14955.1 DnaJ domain-containing protein [Desulfuromonas soudanensis]